MVKFNDANLDLIFGALSDTTRRHVLRQLGSGSYSVTELARPYSMSLPAFMKHLGVLETAGLIARSKEGRVVRCALEPAPIQDAAEWIAFYEPFWNARLDALGRYLYHEEETTSCSQPATSQATPSASIGTTPPVPNASGAPGRTRKR